ncbi:MAG: amidophosphoribosyltransferase [Candidatus Ranarchaeia archaeon]
MNKHRHGVSPSSLKEKCGVLAVTVGDDSFPLATLLYNGLISLQHRGQESCGITIHDGRGLRTHRDTGLVNEVFSPAIIARLDGQYGIGHVRYSTTGAGRVLDTQPFKYPYIDPEFVLAFNGTISNFLELREFLRTDDEKFETDTDTEVISKLIGRNLKRGCSYSEAIQDTMSRLRGAYSIVLLNRAKEIYAFRDPQGFKPLVLGTVPGGYGCSSESITFDLLGGRRIRDVQPGEIVRIHSDGVERVSYNGSKLQRLCMFEFVYFSRPDSIIDNILVYGARKKLGRILARDRPVQGDIVVPLPDTGLIAALGYSKESGLPLQYALQINRYVPRTFIMPNQSMRGESVRMKLNPINSIVKGRQIVLIDDSIVRGTTMRRVIRELRNAGAKAIHVRIACPKIVASCYFGIDFPTRRELIASTRSVEQIREYIGADSLYYNTIGGLAEAIGLSNQLCLSCLTGEYPNLDPKQIDRLESKLGGGHDNGRE